MILETITMAAFDPGPHTGVAFFSGNVLIDADTFCLEEDGLRLWYLNVLDALDNLANAGDKRLNPTVVCETFRTASAAVSMSNAGVLTGKLCGFIEGTALSNDYKVVWQQPAARKPFAETVQQLLTSLPPNDLSVHAISAITHGVAYLAKNGETNWTMSQYMRQTRMTP